MHAVYLAWGQNVRKAALRWPRARFSCELSTQRMDQSDLSMELSGYHGDSMADSVQIAQPLVRDSVSPQRATTMSSKPSRRNLYIAACVTNMASFSSGSCFTWTSPTLPMLKSETSWLKLEGDQSAWIGSLVALGAALGPFLGGFLTNKIGRKQTINIAVILELISWLVLLLASSVTEIYIARLLAGIGCGLTCAIVSMYIGEVAEDEVRGALGSFFALFLCLGFMVEYCFGPYVSYTVLILLSMISPIGFLIIFPFLPESPYYLLQKNNKPEALKSLLWLRKGKSTEEVEKELSLMHAALEEDLKNEGSVADVIATRGNRMALLLSCGLVSFQQLSGINVILFYAESVFDMTGASLSSSISTIIVGIVLNVAAIAAPPLTKRFGIKSLLIVSAVGMMIFQGILGLYFYLQMSGHDVSELGWLPVTVLIGFISLYAVGFGPLPWAVMGEVFPSSVKAAASAITAGWCWFLAFLLTRYFQTVSETLGPYTSFWMFSVFCLVAVLFTVFLLPDTRGMSLQQIQDILNKRSKH